MNKKNKNTKKRNWACVVYPESLPKDWKNILVQTGLEIAISPLHNRDINPDGEIKKEHYHLILCYSGPTTYKSVSELTSKLNAPLPQALESVKGYYRYLTHKDNPEKYQYDECNIQHLGGFQKSNYMEFSKSEIQLIKRKVQIFIRENEIKEYSKLLDLLLDNEMFDEWDVASNNTILFDKYISSKRWGERE